MCVLVKRVKAAKTVSSIEMNTLITNVDSVRIKYVGMNQKINFVPQN